MHDVIQHDLRFEEKQTWVMDMNREFRERVGIIYCKQKACVILPSKAYFSTPWPYKIVKLIEVLACLGGGPPPPHIFFR
jgi:hypothetical protein